MRPVADPSPIAVIDLGSNSIRLVVYDHLSRAPTTRYNERRLCALGREVTRTGSLGPVGQRRAIETLRRFVAIAEGMGCAEIDIVATAAVRSAVDREAFLTAAGRAVGRPVALLSGQEEAGLSALGVACGFLAPRGVMGDLGGGSVELASLPAGSSSIAGVSIPVGALTVADVHAVDPARAERMVDEALSAADEVARAAAGQPFYVVGGSWRALARARMAMVDAPLRVLHGYELSAAETITLGQSIARLDTRSLAHIPGVPRRRRETLAAAGLLLERVVRRLSPSVVVFSATGLREGRVFARLSPEERAADPLVVGARELGELEHRLPGIGEAMARWTCDLLPGRLDQRRLREAACHISDSAWREHPDTRAREAFFRTVQLPLLGVDHAERVFLAYTVFIRYEGQPDDPPIQRMLGLLPGASRQRAEILGRALSLGYRMSAGVPDLLAQSRIERHGQELALIAPSPVALGDDEALQGRLQALAGTLGLARTRITS